VTPRTEDQLDRRLRASLDEATRLAPLANPEWPGLPLAHQPAIRPRPLWRLAAAGAALVAATATVVVVNADDGRRVTAGPPPATVGNPASYRSAVDLPAGPQGSWAPGGGPRTPLGALPEVRADPTARASLAVQVGRGTRWVWAVAGADDRRVRSALDSSVAAPAALSADGRSLAVAFPGLVKVVDLTSGEVRDLAGPLVGGPARSITWASDRAAVAVVRGADELEPGGAIPSTIEVVGLDGTVRRFTTRTRPERVEWSPDGGRLLTIGPGLDGSGEVIDLATGTTTAIPAGPGALVGWYDDRTLLRSQAGRPDEEKGPGAPDGSTTTSRPEPPGFRQGAILFLDLKGDVVRRLDTYGGSLAQLLPPLDPTRRYGLLGPSQGGGPLPYATVVDLQTGVAVGSLTDPRAVPYVIGLGAGTVIVADELPGRFEAKAVDWSTGRATPLAVLAFRDEGFSFAPGSQAAVPR